MSLPWFLKGNCPVEAVSTEDCAIKGYVVVLDI
jgi:hypothetical protein